MLTGTYHIAFEFGNDSRPGYRQSRDLDETLVRASQDSERVRTDVVSTRFLRSGLFSSVEVARMASTMYVISFCVYV